MKRWKNVRAISFFEIALLILGTVAFTYFVAETNIYFDNGSNYDLESDNYYIEQNSWEINDRWLDMDNDKEVVELNNGLKILRDVFEWWMKRSRVGIASAQEGLWTCLENINGTLCQEYNSEICNEMCTETCFPGLRGEFEPCNLGTCFDSESGVCLPGSPRAECEGLGGEWSEENPGQCNPGCCLIGPHGNGFADQTQFVTERTCSVVGGETGAQVEWIPGGNELECLFKAGAQEEGACVLDESEPGLGKYNCHFGTKADCISSGGEFFRDYLCSNPELNSVCEKQKEISCVESKDEIYWLDSCGNRENIYHSNKVKSWNNGMVLDKEDSCELGGGSDPLKNQRSCGNCNYLGGSICGVPGNADKNIVDKGLGDFVCKDLSCVDEWGDTRSNGESWCTFDSQIGVHDGISVDVPGSSHYRKVCFDGEVRTEPCANFRNGICVEERNEKIDFSSAACRINQWQVCLDANTDQDKLDKCEENTDCFLKHIDVDDSFEFDMCVPKHPEGFDLKTGYGGEVGEQICGMASQTCTKVEVKKFSGWKCVQNCDCDDEEFTEKMNGLCVSLGDCGGYINLEGKYTDSGYSVKEAPRISNSFSKYAAPEKNQFVEQLSGKELAALFGVTLEQWQAENNGLDKLGLISGGLGTVLLFAVKSGWLGPVTGGVGEGVAFQMQNVAGITSSAGPSIAAYAGVAAGALVGASIVSLILKYAGISAGLPSAVIYALVLGGAYVGGTYAYSVFIGKVGVFGTAAWVVGVIVIIILIVSFILGIGKTRETKVEFTCSPWQPPTGGADCDKCDDDPDRPCSRYKCNSLGQTCELLNEGSEDEACVNISPNDVSPPVISPNRDAIGENYRYVNEKTNGVKVESKINSDGCIQEYSPVEFGVSLNEPGQCKSDIKHTSSYGEMSDLFGESNLFKENHETIIAMPTLSSLGVPGVAGDPERRGDFDLYLRCQDASGNSNIKEYVINFCISPANDVTPPQIRFIPESPGYAGLGLENKSVQFFTSEPAECRWGLEDKDYELMENAALCENSITQITPNGWACFAILPVTGEEEKDYYFRCEDQPWLEGTPDEGDRNTNTESAVYELIKTTEELKIELVKPEPDEIIYAAGEPVSVNLEVRTSGGVDGSAQCEFSFDPGSGTYTGFFETGGIVHRQSFSTLFEGNYEMALRCKDIAENVATGTASFRVEVDDLGPVITRVYDSSGTLTVITNEPAQCAYDFNICGFNFEEGELMSSEINGIIHTTSFNPGSVYHIKCQDDYGNIGGCLTATGGY